MFSYFRFAPLSLYIVFLLYYLRKTIVLGSSYIHFYIFCYRWDCWFFQRKNHHLKDFFFLPTSFTVTVTTTDKHRDYTLKNGWSSIFIITNLKHSFNLKLFRLQLITIFLKDSQSFFDTVCNYVFPLHEFLLIMQLSSKKINMKDILN